MEIREFAEGILFGDTIEQKLVKPAAIMTDENPCFIRALPTMPHRPSALKFANAAGKLPFPKENAMRDERVRGQVLHFFANHELLALEVMALALLKFADAPPKFRLGLVHTMAEEQQHLVMYMQRMQELGVGFGDVAVNDFFWACLAGMKSPLDYVAGMSLTFEQANLDFSNHYRRQTMIV